MKQLAYIASVLLFSAALAGCAENEGAGITESNTSFSLTAGFETGDETRTANPTAPVWIEGDVIGITIVDSSTGTVSFKNIGVPGTTANGGQTATFAGTLPGFNAGEYVFHGYYPYGTESNDSATAAEAKIVIPAVQKPTANSFDPMADVMLMKSFDYTHAGGAMSQDGLRFKRALGMIKFVLNSSELEGQPVRKLTFRTDNPDLKLAGKADFDLTTGEFTGFYSDAVTEITVVPAEDILADGTGEIWVCIPAMTIGTGVTITVEGLTDGYTFTKSTTVGEANDGQPINIVAGKYHTMNVTLGAGEVAARQPDAILSYARGQLSGSTIYGTDVTNLDVKLFSYDELAPRDNWNGWSITLNTIAPLMTGDVLELAPGKYVFVVDPRAAGPVYTIDKDYYTMFYWYENGAVTRTIAKYYDTGTYEGSYMIVTGDSANYTISLYVDLTDGTSMYLYYEGPMTILPRS